MTTKYQAYGIRETGYPVGGWYVIDPVGDVVRFGAASGQMPRRFKDPQVAWRLAERMSSELCGNSSGIRL